MAAWRRAIELSLGDEDAAKLRSIAQSRTEPASRVERARILLAYRECEDPSFFAVSRARRGRRADGCTRRPPAPWSRADDHARIVRWRIDRWDPRRGTNEPRQRTQRTQAESPVQHRRTRRDILSLNTQPEAYVKAPKLLTRKGRKGGGKCYYTLTH
jgi:hypothetical protein